MATYEQMQHAYRGYYAGNFARSYIHSDAQKAWETGWSNNASAQATYKMMSDGVKPFFKHGFTLGFFANDEDHEIPAEYKNGLTIARNHETGALLESCWDE